MYDDVENRRHDTYACMYIYMCYDNNTNNIVMSIAKYCTIGKAVTISPHLCVKH